tara:strand:- start:759 stop:899 length:141 start_codon:yes stop_codon:yes gene_type:complete
MLYSVGQHPPILSAVILPARGNVGEVHNRVQAVGPAAIAKGGNLDF